MVPSGEKPSDHTRSVWPVRVCRCWPVLVFHSRTVRSYPPEAIMVPSGEKSTDNTEPVWPVRERSSRPVAVSHSRTVSSPDPDAIMVPSGENATEYCREAADRGTVCAGSRPATAAAASSGASWAGPSRPPRTAARPHRLSFSTAPVRSVSVKRAPQRSASVRSAPASVAPVTRAPRRDAPVRSGARSVPPMIWMSSRSALRAISPSALTSRTVALVSFVPVRSAPVSVVAVREAPVRLASRRLASRRSAWSRRASVRFARRRSALRRSWLERSLPARSVSANFAPVRSGMFSRRATSSAFALATMGASASSMVSWAQRAASSRPARSAKKSVISSDISRAASRPPGWSVWSAGSPPVWLSVWPPVWPPVVTWRAMTAATRYSITDRWMKENLPSASRRSAVPEPSSMAVSAGVRPRGSRIDRSTSAAISVSLVTSMSAAPSRHMATATLVTANSRSPTVSSGDRAHS